jgi:hypothetical protein
MADTVRTITEILALLADNTSGDISPQDMRDAIVTLAALSPTIPISSSMTAQGIGNGQFWLRGFYDCPAADTTLSNISTTQAYGTANASYAAHAVAVAGGAGSTDGADLVLTVSGTSITDAGVRTTGDSEIIIADCTAASVNDYFESSKKWLGTITYTLTSSGGTAFTFDFNYGFASYHDCGNTDFTLDNFTMEWHAGANDSGFDVDIHRHETTGWTYHATVFVPGSAPLYVLSTDHNGDNNLVNGENGKWKRIGLSDVFAGSTSEGIMIHITTTVNNSIEWLNAQLNVKLSP